MLYIKFIKLKWKKNTAWWFGYWGFHNHNNWPHFWLSWIQLRKLQASPGFYTMPQPREVGRCAYPVTGKGRGPLTLSPEPAWPTGLDLVLRQTRNRLTQVSHKPKRTRLLNDITHVKSRNDHNAQWWRMAKPIMFLNWGAWHTNIQAFLTHIVSMRCELYWGIYILVYIHSSWLIAP